MERRLNERLSRSRRREEARARRLQDSSQPPGVGSETMDEGEGEDQGGSGGGRRSRRASQSTPPPPPPSSQSARGRRTEEEEGGYAEEQAEEDVDQQQTRRGPSRRSALRRNGSQTETRPDEYDENPRTAYSRQDLLPLDDNEYVQEFGQDLLDRAFADSAKGSQQDVVLRMDDPEPEAPKSRSRSRSRSSSRSVKTKFRNERMAAEFFSPSPLGSSEEMDDPPPPQVYDADQDADENAINNRDDLAEDVRNLDVEQEEETPIEIIPLPPPPSRHSRKSRIASPSTRSQRPQEERASRTQTQPQPDIPPRPVSRRLSPGRVVVQPLFIDSEPDIPPPRPISRRLSPGRGVVQPLVIDSEPDIQPAGRPISRRLSPGRGVTPLFIDSETAVVMLDNPDGQDVAYQPSNQRLASPGPDSGVFLSRSSSGCNKVPSGREVGPLPIDVEFCDSNIDNNNAVQRYLPPPLTTSSYESVGDGGPPKPQTIQQIQKTNKAVTAEANRKTLCLCFAIVSLALLSSSASQLRFLLAYSKAQSYLVLNAFLISVSIFIEVVAGLGYVAIARMSASERRMDSLIGWLTAGLFIVAVNNIIITAFAFDDHVCEVIAKESGAGILEATASPSHANNVNGIPNKSDNLT